MRSRCILWKGALDADGYGQLTRRWRGTRRAPRKAFFDAYGFLPEVVMHLCDNPPCVNPQHLRGGTKIDNIADMWSKGRGSKPPRNPHLRGEKAPWSKLKEKDVKLIRLLVKAGFSQRVLAKVYGVSPATITLIKKRKIWK
jgi:hypothetical protein